MKTNSKELVTAAHMNKRLDKLENKIEILDKKISDTEIRLRVEINLTAQETKEEIREEIKRGNDRLYNVMNDFIKEIRDSRDERVTIGHQLKNHENRIGKLENLLPLS